MTLQNGTIIADRYRLLRHIATGGMGQVWEALDVRLDRHVALKVLKAEFSTDPEFLERFRNEARTTAGLNHPGIASVYDYGETPDEQGGAPLAYLVMEMVHGEPLNAVLNRVGRLSLKNTVDMLEQTGRALMVAHQAGLVHRDVKPGNIMITPTGQVKITDFGIAKAVDAAPVTRTGMVMGTAQYISPEQAIGEDATAASDVYALGVVGYECIAGQRPFGGDGAITVAMKHIREVPPPLPQEVPPNVRDLIAFAMVKDPRQRYRDGGEFADAVAAIRSGHRPPLPRSSGGGTAPVAPPRTALLGASTAALDATGPMPPPSRPNPIIAPQPVAPRPTPRPASSDSGWSAGQKVMAGVAGLLLLATLIALGVVLLNDRTSDTPSPSTTTSSTSRSSITTTTTDETTPSSTSRTPTSETTTPDSTTEPPTSTRPRPTSNGPTTTNPGPSPSNPGPSPQNPMQDESPQPTTTNDKPQDDR